MAHFVFVLMKSSWKLLCEGQSLVSPLPPNYLKDNRQGHPQDLSVMVQFNQAKSFFESLQEKEAFDEISQNIG